MKTIRNSSYVKNQYWKLRKRTNKQTKKSGYMLAVEIREERSRKLEKNVKRERERVREKN